MIFLTLSEKAELEYYLFYQLGIQPSEQRDLPIRQLIWLMDRCRKKLAMEQDLK